MRPTLKERRLAALARCYNSPKRFVVEFLGAVPDQWQADALDAIIKHNRLSIVACHGVGKDTLLAWIILWVMCCRVNCKNPITAPTRHQLYDLCWAELAIWFAKLPKHVSAQFEMSTEAFYNKRNKMTWFTAARTARKDKAEGLQGFHAPTVFIGIDEASGVEEIVFEVLEGATTGEEYYWLNVGNPTRNSGSFYASHTTDDRWYRIGVAAAHGYDPKEHGPLPPHYRLSKRPTADFCNSIARRYGKQSAVYYVRVLGMFAKSDPDVTIPYEWVSEAIVRRYSLEGIEKNTPIYAGFDVALKGSDDCAFAVRQGNCVLFLDTWHNFNEDQTVEHVTQLLVQLWNMGLPVDTLFGDRIGPGASVMRKLALRVGKQFKTAVVGVHVGETSPEDHCHLLRDLLWWRGRGFFEPGTTYQLSNGQPPVFSPNIESSLVDRLQAELSTAKYTITDRNKVKVESKQSMKDRGIDSPDLADAFLLTLYKAPVVIEKDAAAEDDYEFRRMQRRFKRRRE